VQSATVFISPVVWKSNQGEIKCGTPEWDEVVKSLAGRECFGGLDLSSKIDLTSLILVFPFKEEGQPLISPEFPYSHVVVLSFFWTPKDTILEREKRDKVPYFDWWKAGMLEATPGFAVNYSHVAQKIAELNTLYKIRKVAADRWNLTQLKSRLVEHGFKEKHLEPDHEWLIPHGQGYKDMSPAVNVLEEVLLGNRLRHGGHPVLTHCAASAVVDKDPAENRKFFKDKSRGRIDGIVALSMALNIAMGTGPKRPARSRW
jgi:phage terminase large subunit-like protein